MTVFALPDLGEGLTEAEIVAWQVSEGEHIIADQPLVSVETDKAVVEVPAPYSGTVKKLMAQVGDIVKTGAPLVEIDTGKSADSGSVVGHLETEIPKSDMRQAPAPKKADKPTTTVVRASPAVRKMAREAGVDLATVSGSGPGGAIQSSDIVAASGSQVLGNELRGVRRAMARAMTRSGEAVVPATITDRADVHAWAPDEDATVRLVQAIAAACKKVPVLNAWFDGRRLQLNNHMALGLAVDTPDGLIVPVLRGVERSKDIRGQIGKLTEAARKRTAAPADLQGATITLSNFGMLGGEFASLVVSPPQVAILGAGRSSETCVAVDGKPAVRRTLPLSLTFDHRAVAGAEAARFLTEVRAELKKPKGADRKKN